ncbi:pentapeptide repeat-containing protein, partial [Cronobacter sakazakii]|nr:pentapeptide repeat-containing protein [Cronobacter sakazakii]
MNSAELSKILDEHKVWVTSFGANGSKANLSGADLSGANLYGADLSGANLYGANLSGADLR